MYRYPINYASHKNNYPTNTHIPVNNHMEAPDMQSQNLMTGEQCNKQCDEQCEEENQINYGKFMEILKERNDIIERKDATIKSLKTEIASLKSHIQKNNYEKGNRSSLFSEEQVREVEEIVRKVIQAHYKK